MIYNFYILKLVSYMVVYAVLADAETRMTFWRATQKPRNLTSPNFPDPYPSNVSIVWRIYSTTSKSGIHVRFIFLDIEDSKNCEKDNLTIYENYDGLMEIARICGKTTSHEKLEVGNDIIVVFQTNNNKEGKGFVLQYYTIDEDESQGGDDYQEEEYTNIWRIAMILTFALTATFLISAIAVGCYCHHKRTTSNIRNMAFSNSVVADDQESVVADDQESVVADDRDSVVADDRNPPSVVADYHHYSVVADDLNSVVADDRNSVVTCDQDKSEVTEF